MLKFHYFHYCDDPWCLPEPSYGAYVDSDFFFAALWIRLGIMDLEDRVRVMGVDRATTGVLPLGDYGGLKTILVAHC